MAQRRQERERQLAVVLAEKQRLSTLLSKKDAQARQLEFVLKKRTEPATGAATASGAPTMPARGDSPPTPPAAPTRPPRPASAPVPAAAPAANGPASATT
eukprot:1965204-Prymnesium_polylepis.1